MKRLQLQPRHSFYRFSEAGIDNRDIEEDVVFFHPISGAPESRQRQGILHSISQMPAFIAGGY
jgi:hypothetical protein